MPLWLLVTLHTLCGVDTSDSVGIVSARNRRGTTGGHSATSDHIIMPYLQFSYRPCVQLKFSVTELKCRQFLFTWVEAPQHWKVLLCSTVLAIKAQNKSAFTQQPTEPAKQSLQRGRKTQHNVSWNGKHDKKLTDGYFMPTKEIYCIKSECFL